MTDQETSAISLNVPETSMPRIVVVGCGFGGLNLVKKFRNKPYQVVTIDTHNYHTFQPLLYQVATAGLEPDSIAYPIRHIFKKQEHFYFRLASATRIIPEKNLLETNIGDIEYDRLIIATGSRTNYFGMENIRKNSIPLKSVPEALDLRSIILQNFESASLTSDLKERERLMNFVIIGAGPTGVELAGALAELKTHVLPFDYPDLDFRRMGIHLIEMQDTVLPPMSKFSSKHSLAYLEKMGVNVWLNTSVKDYDGKTVFTTRKNLPAYVLIWAAGVEGNLIQGLKEGEDHQKNRYLVNDFNQVGKHQNIYAIGDVAAMISEENPKGHPMLAQVAIQQGINVAKNIQAVYQNKKVRKFKYVDKGTMATIGRNKAVADINHFHFKGFPGWVMWMAVHLLSLVGFRNKMVVLINWILNYFSYEQKIRLIIRPVKRSQVPEEKKRYTFKD